MRHGWKSKLQSEQLRLLIKNSRYCKVHRCNKSLAKDGKQIYCHSCLVEQIKDYWLEVKRNKTWQQQKHN